MGTLLAENPCAHRKRAIEKLIKGRARDAAAQPQILFGKPTGDHDWHEELLVKLLTSFTASLSHILTSSCEDCEVSQIRNQVRSPIGNQRSVDPGESSKRPAAQDRRDFYKRRCRDKNDQGCQETEQVQRIQEAPDMNPTNYFGHHTSISYSLNSPFQNPSLEAPLRSFASMTISTQDSESYSRSYSRSSASSVRKECREETVQSSSLSGDSPFLPSKHPPPTIPFSHKTEEGEKKMMKIATTGDDHHTTITFHTHEEEASSSGKEEASVFNSEKLRITQTRFEPYTMKGFDDDDCFAEILKDDIVNLGKPISTSSCRQSRA